MNIAETIQKLDPGAIIELFEVDTATIGGTDLFRFHAGTNQLNMPVVWQGNTFNPFPVEAEGFDKSTKGTLPRPTLRASNVSGILSAVVAAYDDLVGAKITRRRTFAQYLDAVNFPGSVNPTADPTQYLPNDVFYVERKVNENKNLIEWELASAMDLAGVQLPSRVITTNFCPSEYRGPECSYTGTAYFDTDDQPVSTLAEDVCSKKITGCKCRFGAKAVLPFGGFPSARSYKY